MDSDTLFPFLLIDIETTGLCWNTDTKILEIGLSQVTKKFELHKPKVLVIHQNKRVLLESDPWILKHHGENGLIDQCVDGMNIMLAEQECLAYIYQNGFIPGKILVAGNSVWTDRIHLRRHMPALETCFFHRNLDFSTFKETAKMFGIKEDKSEIYDDHRAANGLEAALDRFWFYYNIFIKPVKKV